MSLDVYLTGKTASVPCQCTRCQNEHTRLETEEFFSANVTHNLVQMAEEAGVYKHLWRPEEIGVTKAGQLVVPLRAAVALMRSDPARFEKHNPSNGWGSYERFVPWIEAYADACAANPEADVNVSR
jgi:hypothetical protein